VVAADLVRIHGFDPIFSRLFADLGPGGCDEVANAAAIDEGLNRIAIGLGRLMGGAEVVGRQLA